MATIANLTVRLTAQTSPFAAAMKAAQSPIRALAATVRSATSAFNPFGGAIAGLVAGGGVAMLAKQSADSIDSLNKLAHRTGETTEALSGLRYAADLANVDTETFDKSMGIFAKTLGKAITGTGDAAKGFELIGVSISDILAQSPGEAFYTVADAFAQIESPALKAVAATDLFGKSGLSMLNVMQDGSRGLRQMQAEAERLGVVVSGIDAQKIEIMNDNFLRLRYSIRGLINSALIQLSPWLDHVAKKLTAWVSSAKGLEFLKTLGSAIASGFATFLDILEKIGKIIDKLFNDFVGSPIGQWFAEMSGSIGELAQSIKTDLDAVVKSKGWTGIVDNPSEFVPANPLSKFARLLFGEDAKVSAGPNLKFYLPMKALQNASDVVGKLEGPSLGRRFLNWIDTVTSGFDAMAASSQSARHTLGDALDFDEFLPADNKIQGIVNEIERYGRTAKELARLDILAVGGTEFDVERMDILVGQLEKMKEIGSQIEGLQSRTTFHNPSLEYGSVEASSIVAQAIAGGRRDEQVAILRQQLETQRQTARDISGILTNTNQRGARGDTGPFGDLDL